MAVSIKPTRQGDNTPMADVDHLWREITGDISGAYREAWRAVAGVMREAEGGEKLLRNLEAALESRAREMVRASYWRGYHAGYREAAGDVLPILGQAQEPPRRVLDLLDGCTVHRTSDISTVSEEARPSDV